jgi:MFS family permease
MPRSSAERDRRLLGAAAFLRACATGMTGVVLGSFLGAHGLSGEAAGLVVSAGLAGAALASLVATRIGDRVGRRRLLSVLALLTAGGTLALAFAHGRHAMAALAFLGAVNGMGKDRGAALVLEQAALPSTTDDAGRTRAFAIYNLLQDGGHALGALLASVPALARTHAGLSATGAGQLGLGLAGLLAAGALPLYAALSRALDAGAGTVALTPVTPATRRVVARVSALFALDALGGGFLTTALVTLFFRQRFGVDETVIGPLFFAARLLNAGSHVGAAWLARRIGLVNTMVFTHIPSSLLLLTVAFAPSFPVAALLFLVREGLVEMDVPTRQSYVMAVVRPEERTYASGVTHLVRLGGWAVAPAFAGLFMASLGLGAPLLIGAAMKITYDVLLYVSFRGVPPPEELAARH